MLVHAQIAAAAAAAAPLLRATLSKALVVKASLEEELNQALAEVFGDDRAAGGRPLLRSGSDPRVPPRSSSAGSSWPVIETLFTANAAVYGAFLVPSIQPFMLRWFTSSATALKDGWRGWVRLFLSTHAHAGLFHLGFNMMALLSFGPRLLAGRNGPQTPRLSAGEFLAMYTAAGLAGSIASAVLNRRLGSFMPSLGASGSLFGVLTYFALMYPEAGLLFFFILPMSAQTGLLAGTAINLWLVSRAVRAAATGAAGPTVDGMAHLAGTAVGAAWYYKRRREELRGSGGGDSGGARRRSITVTVSEDGAPCPWGDAPAAAGQPRGRPGGPNGGISV